jgi:repressor LexA
MPEPLSKMERRILDYLIDYLKRNTYQPSIREIGKRFGIKSTKTVSEYLQSLADKGYIEREASRSRGVRIVGLELQNSDAVTVPYYGKIAAGQPALLRDFVDAEFALDPQLAGSADAFFLEVHGESMEDMGILDGDLVLVEPVSNGNVQNGEIVAARVGGEATVKRYFQREGDVVLQPANTGYAPLLVKEYEDFAVLGRVVGLFRRFTTAHTQAIGA